MCAWGKAMLGIFAVMNFGASVVQAQTNTETVVCPTQQGVYAATINGWIELAIEPAKKENRKIGTLMHDNAVAYYTGVASPTQLGNDVNVCVTGATLGSTLLIAKAQVTKHERRVIVGTMSMLTGFTFKIDGKQSVPFQQTRDDNRNYVVRMKALQPGQYLIYLQQGASLTSIPPAFSFMVQ